MNVNKNMTVGQMTQVLTAEYFINGMLSIIKDKLLMGDTKEEIKEGFLKQFEESKEEGIHYAENVLPILTSLLDNSIDLMTMQLMEGE